MRWLLNIRPVAARHGAGLYLYLSVCWCDAMKPSYRSILCYPLVIAVLLFSNIYTPPSLLRSELFGHVLFFISVLFWGTHCFASDMKIDIRDVKTSAGIGYWYKQKEGLPLVSMTMAFKNAGFIYDPIDKKGLALLATSLISRGTTKDGESIAKLFQEKGIIFHVSVDSDNAYVTLKTLSENLDFALGLIGEVLVDSPIDEEVFVIEKEHQKSDIRRDSSDPGQLAHNMLNKVVFGDQPHAYDASGTLDALEGVTVKVVTIYYQCMRT
ncbi:M16 family metallopeptidase [Anaplasma phagocytophilum]|nr:insulinase family protein [Anaplasma phagocytophilum]KJZ99541.1 insulinase family protein [Anaplasma phagocytophilum str. CR1007]